jgi:hypothetical protein
MVYGWLHGSVGCSELSHCPGKGLQGSTTYEILSRCDWYVSTTLLYGLRHAYSSIEAPYYPGTPFTIELPHTH